MKSINQTLVRSGFTDVKLITKKGDQVADVTFIDTIDKIMQAQGVVVFWTGELCVYNPYLMDYSVALTEFPSPRHHLMSTMIHKEPALIRSSRRQKRQETKTRFCSFIYSNEKTTYRIRFV